MHHKVKSSTDLSTKLQVMFCIFMDKMKTKMKMSTKDKNKIKSNRYFSSGQMTDYFRQDKNIRYKVWHVMQAFVLPVLMLFLQLMRITCVVVQHAVIILPIFIGDSVLI